MIAGGAVGATVLAVAKGGEGVKSGPLGLAGIVWGLWSHERWLRAERR